MVKKILVMALVYAFAASSAAAPALKTVPSPDITLEQQQLQLINRYRKSNHLPLLSLDQKLTKSAKWMAKDMAHHGYFSHVDHKGRSPFTRLTQFGYSHKYWRGENLAAGKKDPSRTFNQWLGSPKHKSNLDNAHFTAVGIAVYCEAKSRYGCYWVTTFGGKVLEPVS